MRTLRRRGVWGSAPQTGGRRAAALPVTRQTRCWPSSEATAHPSLPTEVKSSLAPCFLLSPAKPLCWVSPGAPFEVILPRRTPALLLRPQTAQHGVFCLAGVYSPHLETARKSPRSASTGSIGTISPTRSKSTLSARFSSITRLPLLRRITAAIPFFLRASTLCRISLEIFWALPLQTYQGRSFRRAPWECR